MHTKLPASLSGDLAEDWQRLLADAPSAAVRHELEADPAFRAAFNTGWTLAAVRFRRLLAEAREKATAMFA